MTKRTVYVVQTAAGYLCVRGTDKWFMPQPTAWSEFSDLEHCRTTARAACPDKDFTIVAREYTPILRK